MNNNVVNNKKTLSKIQSISMSEDLIIEVDKILKEDGISRSDFYKKLVNDYLDKINVEKLKQKRMKAFEDLEKFAKTMPKWETDVVKFIRKDRRSH